MPRLENQAFNSLNTLPACPFHPVPAPAPAHDTFPGPWLSRGPPRPHLLQPAQLIIHSNAQRLEGPGGRVDALALTPAAAAAAYLCLPYGLHQLLRGPDGCGLTRSNYPAMHHRWLLRVGMRPKLQPKSQKSIRGTTSGRISAQGQGDCVMAPERHATDGGCMSYVHQGSHEGAAGVVQVTPMSISDVSTAWPTAGSLLFMLVTNRVGVCLLSA